MKDSGPKQQQAEITKGNSPLLPPPGPISASLPNLPEFNGKISTIYLNIWNYLVKFQQGSHPAFLILQEQCKLPLKRPHFLKRSKRTLNV